MYQLAITCTYLHGSPHAGTNLQPPKILSGSAQISPIRSAHPGRFLFYMLHERRQIIQLLKIIIIDKS